MKHTVHAVMTTQVVTARPSSPFHELVRLLEHTTSAPYRWSTTQAGWWASCPRPTC
jgi:hypothetical protein